MYNINYNVRYYTLQIFRYYQMLIIFKHDKLIFRYYI